MQRQVRCGARAWAKCWSLNSGSKQIHRERFQFSGRALICVGRARALNNFHLWWYMHRSSRREARADRDCAGRRQARPRRTHRHLLLELHFLGAQIWDKVSCFGECSFLSLMLWNALWALGAAFVESHARRQAEWSWPPRWPASARISPCLINLLPRCTAGSLFSTRMTLPVIRGDSAASARSAATETPRFFLITITRARTYQRRNLRGTGKSGFFYFAEILNHFHS